MVSASSLAAGVVVTSLTTGMTTDVDSFMFGSILALDRADVALSVGVSAAVLVLYVLFYHRLFAITFDESFSRATGMRVGLYNTVLSVLTALTIVLGMRLMGAMLISSLVIFPALTAMRLLRSFRGVVICAGVLSVACFCAGLTGSYLLSTPVGATVVLADLAAFLLACGAAGLKNGHNGAAARGYPRTARLFLQNAPFRRVFCRKILALFPFLWYATHVSKVLTGSGLDCPALFCWAFLIC